MIELVKPLQKHPLHDDAAGADDERSDHQRQPIVETEILQEQKRDKSAHHVLGAMGEVDDVEHAEYHGEPEAEQGVE